MSERILVIICLDFLLIVFVSDLVFLHADAFDLRKSMIACGNPAVLQKYEDPKTAKIKVNQCKYSELPHLVDSVQEHPGRDVRCS